MKYFKKGFFTIGICLFFISCSKFNPVDFTGRYQLDKHVLRTNIDYKLEPILTIKSNNEFVLQKDSLIKGHWQFISYDKGSAIIEFSFLGNKIFGRFRGPIIYFDYPNDFDNGSFESMLYVKLVAPKLNP